MKIKTLSLTLTLAMGFVLAMGQSAVGQFSFRFVKSSIPVVTLDDALSLLAGQNVESEQRCNAPIFDLVNRVDVPDGFEGFDRGLFGFNLNLLGGPAKFEDHFAIEFVGDIEIPESGTYTFGMNLDDGGRIQIDFGNGFETIVERTNDGATAQFYGKAEFDSLGSYPIRIIYWEHFSDANVEIYSALGDFDEFDTSMRCLGDVNNGGLKLVDRNLRGDINCDGGIDFADIPAFIELLLDQ